jgi:CxxC motif-containing protein (DUF1111 family)
LPGKGPKGDVIGVPNYGDQIQPRAISGVPPEAKVKIEYSLLKGRYFDGTPYELQAPIYTFEDPAYGPFPRNMLVSPRVAPSVFGLGLLEAIPEKALREQMQKQAADGQVSGKINVVWDSVAQKKRIGRFGWKSNQPSLLQQNFSAFLGDMGITSVHTKNQNCEPEQTDCSKAFHMGHEEIDSESLRQVTVYTQLLAVPAARNVEDVRFQRGLKNFRAANCQSCHVESWKTAEKGVFKELAGQHFRPYTDLLLHDMGPGLADGRPDFEADGQEWRTPPLWGVGLIPTVNHHSRYLHDGRARSLEEAVLWHGGEALESRNKVLSFSKEQRDDFFFFLGSL